MAAAAAAGDGGVPHRPPAASLPGGGALAVFAVRRAGPSPSERRGARPDRVPESPPPPPSPRQRAAPRRRRRPRGRRRPLAAGRPRQRPPGRAAAGAAGRGCVAEGRVWGGNAAPTRLPHRPTARPRARSRSLRPASRCPGPCGGRAPGSAQVRGPVAHGRGAGQRPGDGGKRTDAHRARQTQRHRRGGPRRGREGDASAGTEGRAAGKKGRGARPTHGDRERRDTQQTLTAERTHAHEYRGGSAGADTQTHLPTRRAHLGAQPGYTDAHARQGLLEVPSALAPPQVSWAGWPGSGGWGGG